jgi:hypothetical protein
LWRSRPAELQLSGVAAAKGLGPVEQTINTTGRQHVGFGIATEDDHAVRRPSSDLKLRLRHIELPASGYAPAAGWQSSTPHLFRSPKTESIALHPSVLEEKILLKTVVLVLGVLWVAQSGICGDLLFRIDTFGFEGADQEIDKQEWQLLRRIEALVEPNRNFRASCSWGLEEMVLSGCAEAEHERGIKFTFCYDYTKTPMEMAEVLKKSGRKFKFHGSSVQGSVTLLPGKSDSLGGANSVVTSAVNEKSIYSHTEMVASLIELDTE